MSGDKEKEIDYGQSWGPFFWYYHLGAASAVARRVKGRVLRWYGLSIPFTQLSFGLIVGHKEVHPESTD